MRSFTFGHVRQLDKAQELARAWSVGAAPKAPEMTVDVDSTVCEVCGKAKHGAAYGHTKVLGYHPLVAVRADTGEVLHSRMRSGSSQRGNERFARETLARARRLAPGAALTVRADAGFFSYDMIKAIEAHKARYSITIPQNAKVKALHDPRPTPTRQAPGTPLHTTAPDPTPHQHRRHRHQHTKHPFGTSHLVVDPSGYLKPHHSVGHCRSAHRARSTKLNARTRGTPQLA